MADDVHHFQTSLLDEIHDSAAGVTSVNPLVAVQFQCIHGLFQCLDQVIEISIELGLDVERLVTICVLVPQNRNDLAGLESSCETNRSRHVLAGIAQILQISSQIRYLARNSERVAAIRRLGKQQIEILLLAESDQALRAFGICKPESYRLTEFFFYPNRPSSPVALHTPTLGSSDPQRSYHCTDSADRTHRVPVDPLFCRLNGALQKARRNCQLFVPLWTARHSAMEVRHA